MKKLFTIFILLLIVLNLQAQDSRIAIQSAHSGYVTKMLFDNPRNLVISYGSFDDKTLKFWDKTTGILLKTIDIPEHARDLTLDDISGKTYVATKNEFIVYDNTTLNEVKRFPSKEEIQNVAFRKADNLVYYLTGDFDDIALNTFNPVTGAMQKTDGATFPNPQAGGMEFLGNDEYIWFKSGTRNHQFYEINSKSYGELYVPPSAFFKNLDQIYTVVVDETHLKVIRFSATTSQPLWEKIVVVEKNTNRALKNFTGNIAISEESNSLWVSYLKTPIIELNAATGEVKGVIYNNLNKGKLIADKDFVYVYENDEWFGQGNYKKYKRYSNNPVAHFGSEVLNSQNIIFSETDNAVSLFTSDINGKIHSLLSNNATTQLTKYDPNYTSKYSLYGDISVNKEGNLAYYITRNDTEGIKQFVPGIKDSFTTLTTDFDKSSNTAHFNPNSKLLGYVKQNTLYILDVESKQQLAEIPFTNVRKAEQAYLDISPNGKGVAVGLSDEIVFDHEYIDRLDYFNLETKKLAWSKPNSYRTMYHIKDGEQLLAINLNTKTADIFNTATGQLVKSFPIPQADYNAEFAINPSKTKLIFFNKEMGTKIYNITTGKLENESKNFKDLYYAGVAFVNDNVYAQASDGSIKFFNVNSANEILRLILFLDGEWIAHTPEGLFEGSQNAWNRVAFVRGRETIPLDQVFDKFYTPRLLFSTLQGEKINKPTIDIDKIKNPPLVTIMYSEGARNLTVEDAVAVVKTENPSAKITVEGFAKGDKISEVRLYHNNKLVSNNTRNLTVEDDAPAATKKVFNLTLLEGENSFRAVALNSQNTESAPQEISVEYIPKKEEIIKPAGIQLHLMVVGIDNYKNPKYNLNYAVADANGFKSAVDAGMKTITSNVNNYYIKDSEANKDKILQTFKEISSKANPQDVFIFYYAGHGMMTSDENKTFYLVPHDVTQIYGADESIAQKGISAELLKELSAAIPAQKQLYILDACQSGGALTTISSRGAAEEKAIAQLARSTGTHWLTASGSEQFATEFDELGHGVFTYVLLQALSGKADSGDGRITVNELKAYLESQVPEVSGKYRGSAQYPASFGFGQDFPVGVKN
ncbi:caspase family protein [Aequorivita marisscotiae]|uniref:Caspase family protein n=1 Tax=Aequorivita marisscotiae TaxID=3040348 RepID=A0ABY8KV42_9FLAO|nr:caspase family protein [Aequorivita sp. Ant34-E75]WGF92938.1 caspase family protein [Aequorivita sp. Ant34-E75]